MLIFALIGVLELLDYKNPTISQYRVYDSRNEGKEVNLGEAYGWPMFAIINLS